MCFINKSIDQIEEFILPMLNKQIVNEALRENETKETNIEEISKIVKEKQIYEKIINTNDKSC